MGLDVSAYKELRKVGRAKSWEEANEKVLGGENFIRIHEGWHKEFPRHCLDLPVDNIYTYDESIHFRAGSYSGYNEWRRELCLTMIGVNPSRVWNDPSSFVSGPFFWLINFTDCDGIIGPSVCRILNEQFQMTMYQQKAIVSMSGYAVDLYKDFMNAFKAASNNGAIVFE